MAQRTREFQLQAGKETEPLTSWGGVLPLLALYRKTGIAAAVDRTLGLRPEQGYPDSFMIGSLMLLSWCGYDAPEQIRFLEGDTGLAQLLRERRDFGTERFRRETGGPSRRRRRSGRICMNSRTRGAELPGRRPLFLFPVRSCGAWKLSTGSS